MKLSDLPSVEFVDIDTETVEAALFETYTNITGRTLQKADPIRLFILFVADVIVQIKHNINDTGKQNLLKYAEGDTLENLAALVNVTRLPANAATTTMLVTLSAARDNETVVPAGTRISTADNVVFATDEALTITAGDTTGTVSATCTATGAAGNDYKPGEIVNIVDPVAYVASIVNTTTSAGGSDVETDAALRERVFEAPEHYSAAGPSGAYAYFAKSTNSLITDVSVTSPEPGVVQVVPLLSGGVVPEQEVLDDVLTALSADDVRPLTDKVTVLAPSIVGYNVAATYYIDKDADAATVQANVAAAVQNYVDWQKAVLGRDVVPSRLTQYISAVNGVKRVDVTAPAFADVAPTAVAHAGTVEVKMAGSEEE